MALRKSYMTEYGVLGDYWAITSYAFYKADNKTQARISLYVDEQARLDNKAPISNGEVALDGEINRAGIYVELKTKPEFADAEDA